jgi:hypothetical protein
MKLTNGECAVCDRSGYLFFLCKEEDNFYKYYCDNCKIDYSSSQKMHIDTNLDISNTINYFKKEKRT